MTTANKFPLDFREWSRWLESRMSTVERSIKPTARRVAEQVAAELVYGNMPVSQLVVPRQRYLNVNGNYVPPANLVALGIRGQGAGGAGGGRTAGASTWSVGGGGGGGGYAEMIVPAADLPASIPVTIGVGGVGVSGAKGGDGGDTVFGTFMTVEGGTGGNTINTANTTSATATGGPGGLGTVAASYNGLTIRGQRGQDGRIAFSSVLTTQSLNTGTPGEGGSSVIGNGGPGAGPGQTGAINDGTGFGGGGSGILGANQAGAGANGAAGIILLVEYIAQAPVVLEIDIPWTPLPLFANAVPFSLGTIPKYRRVGNTVTIAGIVKPANAAAATALGTVGGMTIAFLPNEIIPGDPLALFGAQQSDGNRHWITSLQGVNTFTASLFGPGAASTSSWLPFSITYQV